MLTVGQVRVYKVDPLSLVEINSNGANQSNLDSHLVDEDEHFSTGGEDGELSLPSYLFLTANAGFLGLMLCLPSRHDQIGTEFSESDPEFLILGIINPVPSGVLPSAAFNNDGGYAAYLKVA
ncbi:UDP-glycosyltransferase 71K1-like [Fagus crenata]